MQLLFHAFGQLARHPIQVLMVSWMLPMALIGANLIAIYTPPKEVDWLTAFVIFGLVVFYMVMTVHVAVSWHRNILLGNRARIDKSGEGAFWRYLGWSIVLGLIAVPITILVAVPWIALLSAGFGVEFYTMVGSDYMGTRRAVVHDQIELLILPITIVVGWVLLRMALVLPGTALKYPLYILRSWRMTRALSGQIFFCSLFFASTGLVFAWYFNSKPLELGYIIPDVLINWLLTMLYIASLTVVFEAVMPKMEVPDE